VDLRGRSALVTGAAGGLGRAITRALGQAGARLVVSGRDGAALAGLAAETGAEAVVADLRVDADLDRLVGRLDDVDVLVLNAGTSLDGDLRDATRAGVDETLEVNLRAPIVLALAFAQAHLDGGGPANIVITGSLSGLIASPNTRLYNATKFGLRGFALSLRQDLVGSAVGVTIVEPGFVDGAGMFAERGAAVSSSVRRTTPEAVAGAVLRAIDQAPPELLVAPAELRLGARVAGVAPRFSEALQRRLVDRGLIRKGDG
jgi:NADP-dependent 3-hydroxy acid dehydrogenase YdfG